MAKIQPLQHMILINQSINLVSLWSKGIQTSHNINDKDTYVSTYEKKDVSWNGS